MTTPSQSQNNETEPEYPELSDSERELHSRLAGYVVNFLLANVDTSVAFGWSPSGPFLMVVTLKNEHAELEVARDITQDALSTQLRDARHSLVSARPKQKKIERPVAVAAAVPLPPMPPSQPANDWDW